MLKIHRRPYWLIEPPFFLLFLPHPISTSTVEFSTHNRVTEPRLKLLELILRQGNPFSISGTVENSANYTKTFSDLITIRHPLERRTCTASGFCRWGRTAITTTTATDPPSIYQLVRGNFVNGSVPISPLHCSRTTYTCISYLYATLRPGGRIIRLF